MSALNVSSRKMEPQLKVETDALPTRTLTSNGISVTLLEADLWSKFDQCTNEMIVTRSGRRMFPTIQTVISGLNPTSIYSIMLDMNQLDNYKWKYVSGDWHIGLQSDTAIQQQQHQHQDTPNFGSHWMNGTVVFDKIKLTNKSNDVLPRANNRSIRLHSLHRYQPMIHVSRVEGESTLPLASFTFDETKFIAVTAYQNIKITNLKITHNPFARAFQEAMRDPPPDEESESNDVEADAYMEAESAFVAPQLGEAPPHLFRLPTSYASFPTPAASTSQPAPSCSYETQRQQSAATNNDSEYPPQRVYWREPAVLARAPIPSYIPEPRRANVPPFNQPEPTSADVPPYNPPETRRNYYPSFQRDSDNSGNSQRNYSHHNFGAF